jgi:hypothetical protein
MTSYVAKTAMTRWMAAPVTIFVKAAGVVVTPTVWIARKKAIVTFKALPVDRSPPSTPSTEIFASGKRSATEGMLLIIYTCEPNPLQIYQYIHTPVKVIFCLIFYCSCLIVFKLVRGEDIHSERIIC